MDSEKDYLVHTIESKKSNEELLMWNTHYPIRKTNYADHTAWEVISSYRKIKA